MSASSSAAELFVGKSELDRRMLAADWSQTPFGPIETWPASLRSALGICLGSRFPIAIYWGPALALLYNDAWSPILGSKHPWALGRAGIEVWPELWETIGPMFEQVMTMGESTYSEDSLLLMHRHGYTEECYFNYSFTPIRGDGRVEGIFNAVIETTYRVISERRTRLLRELGERVATAGSPDEACTIAAQVLSTDGHDAPYCALYLVDPNYTFARLAGVSGLPASHPAAPSEVSMGDVGAGLLGLATKGSHVEVVSAGGQFGELPGGPWPAPSTAAIIAPMHGAARPLGFLVIGASPRRAVDDEYRQFAERAAAHIGTAITTVTAYAAERKRAEELAALDHAKTTFFSNVSHEFRTPLTLMLGPTQDLLDGVHGALSVEQRNQLDLLHRNELRLQKLVNALLDFSRFEAGRVHSSYEPVDLPLLTRELASAFETAFVRAGLTLVLDCPPFSEAIYVDRDMWEKIVLNLLSNALKFTLRGGIEVSLRSVEEHAELRVKDTGVGVPADEVPRLFERFHRVEGTHARTHEGSGIGLALVQELVKLHGGVVLVESEVGVGTTFRVRIPRGTAHLAADRIVAPQSETAPRNATPFVTEALRWLPESTAAAPRNDKQEKPIDGRILLADDNADMRDYVRRHLEPFYRVDAVDDGAKALSTALADPPDLIITDVMMPNLDGFELLRELRRNDSTRMIPVVMLSARAGEEARVEGLDAGAEDYLTKPFSARELLARVRTHFERSRTRRAAEKERDRLLALLGQLPAVVNFLRGPDLVIEFAHPLTVASVGGRQLVGKPLLEAIPEFRDQEYPVLLRRVLATEERVEGHEKLVRLDTDGSGQLRDTYWSFVYLPVRNAENRVEGVMTFDIDVTQHVLARRQIEESEASFRRLVAQVQAGIVQADLSGKIALTNERFRELVGRSEAELRQLHLQELSHADDRARDGEQFQETVAVGRPSVNEKRLVKPDGSIVWVQISVSRLDAADGQPRGVAAVVLDITKRRIAEDALKESEERFRNMADHAPVMVWITEADGRCTFLSQSWYAFTGQTPEMALGFGWLEAVHPDDREKSHQTFTRASERRESFQLEYRLRRFDGEYRWAIDAASPRVASTGEFLGFIGSVLDITDRKRLEAEAAVLAERLATSQRAAKVGIYDWRLDQTGAYWSDELFALLGLQPGQVTPSPEEWSRRIAEADRERGWQVFRDASAERRDYAEWELRIQRSDGQLRWVRMANRIFYGPGGEPIRIVGAAIDIEDLKDAVSREREQREQAERAVRFSEMFVGILGHDLRNPLSAITTAASLLEQRADNERIRNPAKRILTSADRMDRMISQLLDFTRVRLGNDFPVDRAPMDLATLARATIDELELVYARTVELHVSGDTRGTWDNDRLAQLVGNLVANACQHGTPSTPVIVTIDGSSAAAVSLRVQNRGVIATELIPVLFEPMHTSDGSRKRAGSSGLGLGLFITKQIAIAHGGSISVVSDEQRGTTFHVELPRH